MGARIVAIAIGLWLMWAADAAAGDTDLITDSAVTGSAAGGVVMAMSPDARYVAFQTSATNLLPGGNPPGLYLEDRLAGTVELVSVDSQDVPARYGANDASVSADGRYVVFSSYDAGLVRGDTNGTADVFLRDRVARSTVRLSVSATGVQGNGPSDRPGITPDGRYVLFVSAATTLVTGDTNLDDDVFVRDLKLGVLQRVSLTSTGRQANSGSLNASISADGRYVAFQSWADDVVPGDTNLAPDIFVRDRSTGTVERVSVNSSEAEADGGSWPASQGAYISGDGRYVVFNSFATNLVPGDTNGFGDVFIRDRVAGVTERVNVSSGEVQSNDDAWADGVSADGRYVVFESSATNLVPGDLNGYADIFLRDRQAGITVRGNVSASGVQANGISYSGMVSDDGRFVTFNTEATNLVSNDANLAYDGYVHAMGISSSADPFQLGTATLDFGKLTLNTARGLSIILSNTSGADLRIVDVRLTGVDAALFKVSHDCGTVVAPGSACGIRVSFKATSLGTKVARLRVTAGSNVERSVSLTGTGVPALLDVTPGALAFGSVPVGSVSAWQLVTIRNVGEGSVPLHWIALAGANAADFRNARACPASLGPGRTCRAFVYFAPLATGARSASLIIALGTSGARRVVTLSGDGR